MSLFISKLIIPRPLSDVVLGPFEIRAEANLIRTSPSEADKAKVLGGGSFTLPPAKKMIAALLRIALIAGVAFAVNKFGITPSVNVSSAALAGLAAAISVPASLILAGGYVAYLGGVSVVTAIAASSFTGLGTQFGMLAAGWLTLQFHDIAPFGLVEGLIGRVSDNFETPLAELFI